MLQQQTECIAIIYKHLGVLMTPAHLYWLLAKSAQLWIQGRPIIGKWGPFSSLRKKFLRSQAQRAGNRHILEARKKLHKPELFFAKAWAVWKFWYDYFARDVFYSGTHLCLWLKGSAYMSLFTFKERNSGLFCPIFLKFTFDNFASPVGLAILKFYLPATNFTSLGHQACTIFQRLLLQRTTSSELEGHRNKPNV